MPRDATAKRRTDLLISAAIAITPPTEKFAPINRWCLISGMGRTQSYQALAAKHLRGKKVGSRLLIDVEHGLAWLRSLPDADIRLPNSRRPVLTEGVPPEAPSRWRSDAGCQRP
jgi:hypothetical protein